LKAQKRAAARDALHKSLHEPWVEVEALDASHAHVVVVVSAAQQHCFSGLSAAKA
jgi:hypothetical protein